MRFHEMDRGRVSAQTTPEVIGKEETMVIHENANVFIMKETDVVDDQLQIYKKYSMHDIKQIAEKHEIIREFNN
jgi:hypothetical protein